MTATDHISALIAHGKAFYITGKITIPQSSSIDLLGEVDGKRVSLLTYSINSSQGPVSVNLKESPNVTDNGTQMPVFNRNRNFEDNPYTKAYIEPTYTGGNVIYESYIHDIGGGSHTQGGDANIPTEIKLKDNTNYIFSINNIATSDTDVSFQIIWSEEH